ncbi:MAG: DEAD/DEAH box helicase, partial [Leucothrix sp.]
MTHTSTTLRVVIPRPLYRAYDYECLEQPIPKVGCRVRVPLGPHSLVGIVIERGFTSDFDKLRPIESVIDSVPLFDSQLLDLLQWASVYYHHPIGEVLFTALPKRLRKGLPLLQNFAWHLHANDIEAAREQTKRAKRQLELLNQLHQHSLTEAQLTSQYLGKWRGPMKALAEKGLCKRIPVVPDTGKATVEHANQYQITLSEEQDHSLAQLSEYLIDDTLKPILLHGITGSGKTEIYLRAIKQALLQGKQALLMIPEIGLTPQLFQRFCDFFPEQTVVALHSGLNDLERTQNWQSAQSGEADIVVGTRSSVFCGFKKLGMIIIDEEHDGSFKQQEGFHYHARDLAVKRASQLSIPIIL